MPGAHVASVEKAPQAATRGRRVLTEHRPFLVALLLGAGLRVVVWVAFFPAFIFSDGPAYLLVLDTHEPRTDRPAGYSLFVLQRLLALTDQVAVVTVAQHLMGLATACLVYVLLRKWGVGRWPSTLATLPVLFDGMQLSLEQSVLADTFFQLIVMVGVVILGWRRRPSPVLALAAGLVFGSSVTVRLVGEPLVVAAVAYCLLVGQDWRARATSTAAVIVGFTLPLLGYAAWYHSHTGVFALTEFTGKSLYLRTTTFVDCSRISVPRYQRVLCPGEPLGQRLDPTWYGWHDERTIPRLDPPSGTTDDQAMHEFALTAIRAQPLDYARLVAREFMLNFDPGRGDRFGHDTAHKWHFADYVDPHYSVAARLLYDEHGGHQPVVRQPLADALVDYQRSGYLPGPLLLGCLVVGLLAGLGIGRARQSGVRSMCLLLTGAGTGLLLMPDVTAEFVWRYQLPALALLPAGAALGYSALRGRQAAAGTVATPSTD